MAILDPLTHRAKEGRGWNLHLHSDPSCRSQILYLFFLILSFLPFLGPLPWHMEVPRLGVELELQPLAYTSPRVRHTDLGLTAFFSRPSSSETVIGCSFNFFTQNVSVNLLMFSLCLSELYSNHIFRPFYPLPSGLICQACLLV